LATDPPPRHIIRPGLPWRAVEEPRTECGRAADSVADTIDRDELAPLARKLGRTRTYMVMCVTCLDTAQRWPAWDESPVGAMGREVHRSPDPERFATELRAIDELIARHRDEFDQLVAGLADAPRLDDHRRARLRPTASDRRHNALRDL